MSKHTPYWTRVINNALKREDEGKRAFTEEHRKLAGSFVTCACGKQDPRLLDTQGGGFHSPHDDALRWLGFEFSGAVRIDDPSWALKVLLKIEARAGMLVAGMEGKNE